jgi:hypothetical protein
MGRGGAKVARQVSAERSAGALRWAGAFEGKALRKGEPPTLSSPWDLGTLADLVGCTLARMATKE